MGIYDIFLIRGNAGSMSSTILPRPCSSRSHIPARSMAVESTCSSYTKLVHPTSPTLKNPKPSKTLNPKPQKTLTPPRIAYVEPEG